jgi:hypothetical protein
MGKLIGSGSPFEDSIRFSRACRVGNIVSASETSMGKPNIAWSCPFKPFEKPAAVQPTLPSRDPLPCCTSRAS